MGVETIVVGAVGVLLAGLAGLAGYLLSERKHTGPPPPTPPAVTAEVTAEDGFGFSRDVVPGVEMVTPDVEVVQTPSAGVRGRAVVVVPIYGEDRNHRSVEGRGRHALVDRGTVNLADRAAAARQARDVDVTQVLRTAAPPTRSDAEPAA